MYEITLALLLLQPYNVLFLFSILSLSIYISNTPLLNLHWVGIELQENPKNDYVIITREKAYMSL